VSTSAPTTATAAPAVPAASSRRPLPLASQCCGPLLREPISAGQAADLSRLLKALADPTRLRLVSMVAAHEGGEACVCDLVEPVGLSQPTVSHHLKQLTDAGLVTREKRGVWAYFTIVPGALQSVTRHLESHLGVKSPA
jgi:ArsR family transcriptional regulator